MYRLQWFRSSYIASITDHHKGIGLSKVKSFPEPHGAALISLSLALSRTPAVGDLRYTMRRLAFHTGLVPHFPPLHFGPAFSSPVFSVA